MLFLIVLIAICNGYSDRLFEMNRVSQIDTMQSYRYPSRRAAKQQNLNETFFASLDNYQVNAITVSEEKYPWVARVIHSKSHDYPYMCTASCISERIFITAARCIYSLKVAYTTIMYKGYRLSAVTFVLPQNATKQLFDDIGFIVTEKDEGFSGPWATIPLVNRNRTSAGFQWFDDWNLSFGPNDYKVVGYATKKGLHRFRTADRIFDLAELSVVINMKLCTTIMTFNFVIQGFFVPCYYSCTLHQFNIKAKNCANYHGVEGGAVIDAASNKLLGVATWGAHFSRYELPVGFSVPNSVNFYKDYECATRIRKDPGILVSRGYYQSLCMDD